MRWIEKLRMRVQMVLHWKREGERLNAELQFHLDGQMAENIRAGMTPEEARTAALRSFGNPTVLREQAREAWNWTWLERLLRDARIGTRTLLRTPGFAVTAVLIMGLGIGANVALFTVVRSVLLRPLPFPDPSRLVMLYGNQGDPPGPNVVAAGDFYDWQKAGQGFEQMAIWRISGFNLSGSAGELPEFVNAGAGSWNLFSTLGVQPVIGRAFTSADDQPSAAPTVILTWSFFERRYQGNSSVIGQTILLNGRPYAFVVFCRSGLRIRIRKSSCGFPFKSIRRWGFCRPITATAAMSWRDSGRAFPRRQPSLELARFSISCICA